MNFLDVTVVFASAPRIVHEWKVRLLAPAVVADGLAHAEGLQCALMAAGLPGCFADCKVGVWGKLTDEKQALCDHDRIEIYRDLSVDPKIARRERFKKQGRRSAGLFTKNRVNHAPATNS